MEQTDMKWNGTLKYVVFCASILVGSGIAWGLLQGDVSQCKDDGSKRDKRIEKIEQHTSSTNIHEPNGIKAYRIDSRMQGFYNDTIKPDLVRMEQRIMLAPQKLEARIR